MSATPNASDLLTAIVQLRGEVRTLATQLRSRSRGTGDHAAAAKAASEPPVQPVETEAAKLYNRVRTLVTERPMRFQEIMAAVGLPVAEENRVKGTIVRMQRERVGLVNLGDQRKALWFIPSEDLIKKLRTFDATQS